MAEGKLLVLGTILKLDRPFRPPHITDMTGLDRNLVAYHLRMFTEKGYLEKIDKHYVIRDKEGLLESLLDSAEKTETAKMKPRGFFSATNAEVMNRKAETLVAARTLDVPMSQAAKEGLLKKIDDSIAELKNLRKYITNSTKTEGSAIKFMRGLDSLDWVWVTLVEYGGFGYDEKEITAYLESLIKDNDE